MIIDNRQVTEDGYQAHVCTRLARHLSADSKSAVDWLTSLQGHLLRPTTVPSPLINLLASVLVMEPDTDVSKLAVDRLVDVARWDVSKVCHTYSYNERALVAQLDAPSDWRPGGRGFNPCRGRQHSFVEIDHEIFSTVILSLPLIQEAVVSFLQKNVHNTG